ncbi:MAG: hypothetical protein ACJAZF_000506 [Granulosicoccus sp.]|jgi:hypothetical protein
MSHKSDPSHKLVDRDLAALFNRQEIAVPKSLDDIILEASRQVQIDTSPHVTLFNKYSPWLAIAAVLALAVTPGPFLLNAPQSEMQELRKSNRQELILDLNSYQMPDLTERAAKVFSSSAPVSIADMPPEFESVSRSPLPTSADSTFPSRLNEDEFEYRKSRGSWLRKTQKLVFRKQLSKARIEYDLFRKIHPTYDIRFKLPKQ